MAETIAPTFPRFFPTYFISGAHARACSNAHTHTWTRANTHTQERTNIINIFGSWKLKCLPTKNITSYSFIYEDMKTFRR